MTTEEVKRLAQVHAKGMPMEDYREGVCDGYQAGFTKQNELAIALLQQKQKEAKARWIAHGNTSDSGILNILRELLEELTIQP